eukprot:721265-Prymnesium_polylepis.1
MNNKVAAPEHGAGKVGLTWQLNLDWARVAISNEGSNVCDASSFLRISEHGSSKVCTKPTRDQNRRG